MQLLDRNDEIVDAWSVWAVFPLSVVAYAVYFLVQTNCAALRHANLLSHINNLPNHAKLVKSWFLVTHL
jgi:hypothetical protein